jgi:ribonucleoside-triphosphate reductase
MDMAMKLCRNTQIGYFAFTRDITVSLRQFHEMRSGSKSVNPWIPSDFPIKV